MARLRSPNHPQIGLEEAINRTRTVYEKEHTNPAARVVIAESLGYQGITGKSATVIGALRQFGLLVGRGENLHVSDAALTLIHAPGNSEEYRSALINAAIKPELFSQIGEHFGESMPSNTNLRYFLAKKGFSKRATETVIKSFYDSMEFVRRQTTDVEDEAVNDGFMVEELEGETFESPQLAGQARQSGVGKAQVHIHNAGQGIGHIERTVLSPGMSVEIRFSGEPTLEDFEALADYVEFRKKRVKRVGADSEPSGE